MLTVTDIFAGAEEQDPHHPAVLRRLRQTHPVPGRRTLRERVPVRMVGALDFEEPA